MKPFTLLLSFLVSFSLFAEDKATVNTNTLRMRAQAGLSYEVVGLLKKGHTVTILHRDNDWVQITAPEKCSAWIAKRHLDGDKIVSDKASIHAGSGIVFSTIGTIKKGHQVNILKGQDKLWQEVCVPGQIKVWVKESYLTIIKTKPKTEIKELIDPINEDYKDRLSVAEKQILNENEVCLPAIDHKHDDSLLHKTVKPRAKVLKGYLLQVREQDQGLVDFALAKYVNGHYFPICYLKGHKKQLSKNYLKHLEVEGTLIYKQGWIRPLLEVKKFKNITTKGSN